MKFCEGYFGVYQAWILGWILAVSNFQIFHEFLGLREPLESVGALSLLFLLLSDSWSSAKKWGLAGISAVLMLTRVGYVQVLLIVLGIFFRLNRWRARDLALVWGIGVLLVVPHYLYSRAHYGDPLYFSHEELGKLWGRDFEHRPGYPHNWTEWAQEGEKNIHPMTLGEFLFKAHRWWQAPVILGKGVYNVFFKYDTVEHLIFFRYPVNAIFKKVRPVVFTFLFLLCLGYFEILREPGKRRFVLFLFLFILPFYLGAHIYVLHRYLTSISPLIYMVLSCGLIKLFSFA